jgi:hypothetical protein
MRAECYYEGRVLEVLLVEKPFTVEEPRCYVYTRGAAYPVLRTEMASDYVQIVTLGVPIDPASTGPMTTGSDGGWKQMALNFDDDTPLPGGSCNLDGDCESCQ